MLPILLFILFKIFLNSLLVSCLSDEIISLPGINFTLNFKHYSGYLNAGNNNLFHYWFVESQGNPTTDPLVLWLNGGPGCSSLGGLFNELGPYLVNKDGKTLRQNPYSWNKYASIIFLESPAWVGFSYKNSTIRNVTTSDDETAEANYEAIKDFLIKYPSFKSNPLFLTGESYAGFYLPMLASKIVDGMKETPLNLKGVAIGNGLMSNIFYENTLLDFNYGHGFIDEQLWKKFKVDCCKCADDCDVFSFDPNSTCTKELRNMLNNSNNELLNGYDLYADCEGVNNTKTLKKRRNTQQSMLLRKLKTNFLVNNLAKLNIENDARTKFGVIPCVDVSAIEHYLNLPEVQKSINIPSNKKFKWEECPDDVYDEYYIDYYGMFDFTKNFLNSKIRLTLYYGDNDGVCNFLIGQKFSAKFGFKLKTPKQPWILDGQVGGFKTEYERGLTFTTVRGGGHMVPQTNPKEALYIFKQFLDNKPL